MEKLAAIILALFVVYIIIGVVLGLLVTWSAGERITFKELLKFSLMWVKFYI